ncbi:hypothetical protein C2845_PM02G11260 [Panicum miliaceum]|uniref:Mitochondrial import inner membrane translocase subunit n=1 Tax=Panicum miliaceum TaxID=4540 RepID=A0A3L6SHT4_PANMI|nr:hypothetical protein C2845_PM02G11260 [Panicum miliaceum]
MDKSMLGDLDGLPEEDKMRMAAMIEQLQIRDSLQHFRYLERDNFVRGVDAGGRNASVGVILLLEASPRCDSVSLRMYNSLVERCFTDCVDTFRRKTLDKQEESCVRRCAEKFLKHSMRVGMRFAELNQGVATPD